jgi:hypothetical protein
MVCGWVVFIVHRAIGILGHRIDLAFHALPSIPDFHFRDPSRMKVK